MKTLKIAFLVLLPFLLGACDKMPSEPNVPPESIVIVTVPFIEVTTTATTADIKSTINTNGAVSVSLEYGIGNYTNTANAVPTNFSINTTVNTKLTELIPGTKYQFRIKAVTGNNVTKYLVDSSFTTSQIITTVSFLEIVTTATTADIKSTINTNGAVSVSLEYGIGNYANTANAVPTSFSINTTVNTKLTELIPNTKYQFRIKAVTGNNVAKYIADSSFTTDSQLQIGDIYKKGVVIEVHVTNGVQHGLLVAPFDQSDSTKGATLEEGKVLCAQYNGYVVPDTTQLKLIKNAIESGILQNNFQKDGLYLSSTVFIGNPDWIYALHIKNGAIGLALTPILGRGDIRGVSEF